MPFLAHRAAILAHDLRRDGLSPSGRMVFTVLGALAELERSLIPERVREGLRNARAKGKRLGRPRVIVDARRIADLRNANSPSAATLCGAMKQRS